MYNNFKRVKKLEYHLSGNNPRNWIVFDSQNWLQAETWNSQPCASRKMSRFRRFLIYTTDHRLYNYKNDDHLLTTLLTSLNILNLLTRRRDTIYHNTDTTNKKISTLSPLTRCRPRHRSINMDISKQWPLYQYLL